MEHEQGLPHLRAACEKARARIRPEYALNNPQAFDKPHVDDWFDDLRDAAALIAWMAVWAALGVFLFVAMAAL